MELVTGRKGEAHVTSQQDRMLHQGVFGVEAYILNTGKKLRPEVQSSNEIRIRDGALMVQGALSCVKINTYDSITIQNGTQGMKRIDLVVWQYVYNAENDTEYSEWNVIQGTPDEIEPHMPEYVQGDIQSGDNFVQVPYLAVHLDGINITEVRTLLEVIPDIYTTNKNLTESITELNRKLPACNEIYTGVANHAQYDIPDITPYDLLVIYGGPGTYANTSVVIPVESIVYKDDGQFALGVHQGSSTFWELEFNFPSSTKINIANYKNQSWTTPAIRKILGVKL